jgi:RNA polymerase sigma-70 factor (ECF subfamily)
LAPTRIAADDIVQEVFVRVWINRERINPDKEFQSYLFTIAKNLVLDQLKSAVNRRLYFVDEMFQKDLLIDDVSEESFAIEHEERLMKLLEQIPERRREIFCLNKFEGLSYKQIALRLNISENTVDSQIRNALDYIRKEFKTRMILFFFRFFK